MGFLLNAFSFLHLTLQDFNLVYHDERECSLTAPEGVWRGGGG